MARRAREQSHVSRDRHALVKVFDVEESTDSKKSLVKESELWALSAEAKFRPPRPDRRSPTGDDFGNLSHSLPHSFAFAILTT